MEKGKIKEKIPTDDVKNGRHSEINLWAKSLFVTSFSRDEGKREMKQVYKSGFTCPRDHPLKHSCIPKNIDRHLTSLSKILYEFNYH